MARSDHSSGGPPSTTTTGLAGRSVFSDTELTWAAFRRLVEARRRDETADVGREEKVLGRGRAPHPVPPPLEHRNGLGRERHGLMPGPGDDARSQVDLAMGLEDVDERGRQSDHSRREISRPRRSWRASDFGLGALRDPGPDSAACGTPSVRASKLLSSGPCPSRLAAWRTSQSVLSWRFS